MHFLEQQNAELFGAVPEEFGLPSDARVFISCLLWLAAIIAAMVFMWSVRRSKTE